MIQKIFASRVFIYTIVFLEAVILFFLVTSYAAFQNTWVKNSRGNDRKSIALQASDLNTTSKTNSANYINGSIKSSQTPTSSPIPTMVIKNAPRSVLPKKSTPSIAPAVFGSGIPARLIIPKLGVNAYVEQVGLDSAGAMDVPKKFTTAAWYKLGYKIGDNGNAVFSGHYDTYSGSPAIFWNISKLNAGDSIIVIDTGGTSYRFMVREKRVYEFDKFPLQEVFGTAGTSGVNLITCSGEWDKIAKNYSTRTVIYASKF